MEFKPLGFYLSRTNKNGILYSGPSYLEFLDLMKRNNPDAYNRLLIEVAKGKSPHSEVVNYRDTDGNYRTTTNVGAGYVSGVDPIGLLVVEGAVMNKPLLWIGKGVVHGIRRAVPKGKITSNNPKYQMKSSDVDELELTKDRLRNGGFNRLEDAILDDYIEGNSYEYIDLGRKHIINNRNQILSSKPFEGSVKEFNKKFGSDYEVEDGAAGLLTLGYSKPFSETGIVDFGNRATAHEFSHYVYWPNSHPPGFNPTTFKEYFLPKTSGAGEVTARGTLLKNYFRLKEGEEITPEMWEYAKKNYVRDTGLDNNMTEFFNSVNSKQLPEFLKWLNKHSPVIIAPLGLGTLYGINNESTNTNK